MSTTDLLWVRHAIAKQQALVDAMPPAADGHRLAVELLLTYQDSLFVLEELRRLIDHPDDPAKDRW